MTDVEVFVSYASEDRSVAQAIAGELTTLGIPTFFDRFSIQLGDSVFESVQRGLMSAKFGVVVVSPAYLAKHWPRGELKQLLRAHIEGRTRILPVWHNVTPDVVHAAQPALDDIWGISTDDGLRSVVRAVAGQIVDATIAVVPLSQRPVHRFELGEGELTLGFEGPSFTIFEALLNFEVEMFPLYVEGAFLDRLPLLAKAGEALAHDAQAQTLPIDAEQRARIAKMCRDEIGLELPGLEA